MVQAGHSLVINKYEFIGSIVFAQIKVKYYQSKFKWALLNLDITA